jgi:hypothetical protein
MSEQSVQQRTKAVAINQGPTPKKELRQLQQHWLIALVYGRFDHGTLCMVVLGVIILRSDGYSACV